MAATTLEAKVCPRALSCFLKGLIEDVHNSLQSVHEEEVDFFRQCKEKCCHLLKSSQAEDITADGLRQIMQETAHVVLEYTYQDETLLVDSEFPAASATHRLATIQEQLDKICQVAEESFPDQPVVGTLGEEIVECVHWRKGALFYMYCHTVNSHNRPVDPLHYRQCLEGGVLELQKMLSTRQPTAVPSDLTSEDTLQLFSHSVYSDTHLLALMYGAEMCYWHQQAMDRGQFPVPDIPTPAGEGSHPSPSPFSAKRCALQQLESYLAAVEGPLKGQGWSTDRAKEFVQYFRQLQKD